VDARGASQLDSVRAFATPEHIAFEFRLAGPSARALAWLIDLLIRGGAFLALAVPLASLGMLAGIGMILFLWFVLDWLAGGLCEWLWHGQTPGKRALGIRVVGIDGLPAGLGSCLLRNILRWADGLPFVGNAPTFAAGLVAMTWSGTFQRLGDFAAGTLVVSTAHQQPPKPAPPEGAAAELAARLPPELAVAVDGAEARAVASYVARRRQFHPQRRTEMAEHLAGPLRRRFALDPRLEADLLLGAVHVALFPPEPARGAPVAIAAGGRAAALLARRRPEWLRLEALIAGERGVGDRGSAGRAEAAIELSRLYRSACADLALAGAYHLPRAHVAYLHGLVAKAHLRFYRRIGASGGRRLERLLLVDVPARLYGDGCLRVALLAFFGVFLAAGTLGWARPEMAALFVGEHALADLRDLYAEAPRGRGSDAGAAMGGFYLLNNVGIALACFASGIFAGVGSLVWLVFNGLYLGLCFGFMAGVEDPTRAHFFEFVSAHGPFELTGIALAGAAGLRMGLGLVVRRGLPRLEALRRSAAEAVPVMVVAGLLVALAAPIEAFVSPSSMPLAGKRSLMGLCTVALLVYLVGLGARARRIQPPSEADAEAGARSVAHAALAGAGPAGAR
jgi:uncharacterized membrane protein SpoIIM required for sporulation/uncharacterized RDD family membrane protein YckC